MQMKFNTDMQKLVLQNNSKEIGDIPKEMCIKNKRIVKNVFSSKNRFSLMIEQELKYDNYTVNKNIYFPLHFSKVKKDENAIISEYPNSKLHKYVELLQKYNPKYCRLKDIFNKQEYELFDDIIKANPLPIFRVVVDELIYTQYETITEGMSMTTYRKPIESKIKVVIPLIDEKISD